MDTTSLTTSIPFRPSKAWFIPALALLPLLAMLQFGVQVATAPESLLVQYVPDDAYYYLTLARNFTHFGTWTFDNGNSLTTGFHPLFAYLMVGIDVIAQPSAALFVRIGVIVGLVLTGAVSLYAARVVAQRHAAWLLTLALIVSSPNIVLNSISSMEWPLVVAAAALLVCGYWRGWRASTLLVIGLTGSLARSDFGILPTSMLLAAALTQRPADIRRAAGALAGAVTGVLLTFLHNLVFTGEWLQNSARVKSFWAEVLPTSLEFSVGLPFRVLGSDQPVTALIICVLMLIVLCVLVLRLRPITRMLTRLRHGDARAYVLLLASVMTITAYVVFYSRNGEQQAWYTANLVVPMFVVWGAAALAVWGFAPVRILFICLTLAMVAANALTLHPFSEERAPYPHQLDMLRMGERLASSPPDGRVGAWNAGILGYVTDGRIINLDGLVNNDVYPYIVTNRLPEYVAAHVDYIADFSMMMTDSFRRRGGYDTQAFTEALTEASSVGNMLLWRVEVEMPLP